MPQKPEAPASRFNPTSMLTGFALGAVITVLAAIAVVPNGGTGDGSAAGYTYADPGEGGAFVDPATGETIPMGEGGSSGGRVIQGGGGAIAGSSGAPGEEGAGGINVGSGSGPGSGPDGGGFGGKTDAKCKAGKNDGGTDTGVSGDSILLGATHVKSGFAAAFLGEVSLGMDAVKDQINRDGGICGRQLKILYKDDGWNAGTGAGYIDNLIRDDKVFALAVSPSSQGLDQASKENAYKMPVPVVGADGLNRSQFKDSMIWPVAASTTTTVHIMIDHAYKQGARNPAIVFGNTYRFGVEGAYAFAAGFCKAAGGTFSSGGCSKDEGDIPGYSNPLTGSAGCAQGSRFCGVPGDAQQYPQVQTVNDACKAQGNHDPCDFVLLLLEPRSAEVWMGNTNAPTSRPGTSYEYGMGGAQPLFTWGFGDNCAAKCDGMLVWTGYNPPLEEYRNQPAVDAFVKALKSKSSRADEFNQFTMGGYIGMKVLVEALTRVGSNLTRERLVQVLNSMESLKTGLTNPSGLQWRAGTGEVRFANHSAQAFRMNADKAGFTGYSPAVSYQKDRWLGQDTE